MTRRTHNSYPLPRKLAYPIGVLGTLLALYIATALLTYHGADPSPNHAVSNPVENLGGSFGAYLADPLYQFLGISAFFLSIVPLVWSIRLFTERKLSLLWVKCSTVPFLLISSAALLATIPKPAIWPFLSFGGFIGEYVKVELSIYLTVIGLLAIALPLLCASLILSLGLTRKEVIAIAKGTLFTLRMMWKGIKIASIYTARGIHWAILKIQRKEPEVKPDAAELKKKREKIVELKKEEPAETLQRKQPPPRQTSLQLSDGHIELPDIEFLKAPPKTKKNTLNESALAQNARLLEKVLSDFGIQGEITKVRPGPVVTLYELEPSAGTKSSRVIGLADDIARSMSAISARIAVIPGRNAIGIELPNTTRETVFLREMLESEVFKDKNCKLPLALGKDIGGDTVVADLSKMPHVLVAGTTGSGKSVAINAMIVSLLYRMTPDECRFIMIDPKMLELSVYDGIPHLLSPVVTEPGKAVVALKWTTKEMENRYRLMSGFGVRNISSYNKRIEESLKKGEVLERTVQTGFDADTGKPIYETVPLEMKKMPFIVVIVDEMADLMLVAGKEIEGTIQRLAQMARAAGIHIVMATQRPSVDVITGVIKANFPTRISFQVTSRIDSRTILGEMGAEQLLGMGDMLYMAGGTKTTRVHGAFVDDKEVENIVSYLKTQASPDYIEDITEDSQSGADPLAGYGGAGGAEEGSDEALYDQAVSVVLRDKKASTSYVQRKLRIGYNRAAMLIEKMEEEGVISAPNHAGKREVLVENA